jgi:hypothetical protein
VLNELINRQSYRAAFHNCYISIEHEKTVSREYSKDPIDLFVRVFCSKAVVIKKYRLCYVGFWVYNSKCAFFLRAFPAGPCCIDETLTYGPTVAFAWS